MKNISIAIHGGAGTILRSSMTPEKENAYKNALQEALDTGYALLDSGATAVDAVEKAVTILEDCPLFNAGKGAVFTAEGTHELDASIMEGKSLFAGAVAMVTGVKNPVQLARLVMEKSGHVFLAGQGAEHFARKMKCAFETPAYFHDDFRFQQWQAIQGTDEFKMDHDDNNSLAEQDNKPNEQSNGPNDQKFGTVGAVALDQYGNLAAATSTGGMTNKKFGRVGDSPMIGAGNYANNHTCAVSCTGSGEFFIRAVVAYDVSCLMEYKGLSLKEACREVIQHRLKQIEGDGGLIAVDGQGNICLEFNTEGMYRGQKSANGLNEVLIYRS